MEDRKITGTLDDKHKSLCQKHKSVRYRENKSQQINTDNILSELQKEHSSSTKILCISIPHPVSPWILQENVVCLPNVHNEMRILKKWRERSRSIGTNGWGGAAFNKCWIILKQQFSSVKHWGLIEGEVSQGVPSGFDCLTGVETFEEKNKFSSAVTGSLYRCTNDRFWVGVFLIISMDARASIWSGARIEPGITFNPGSNSLSRGAPSRAGSPNHRTKVDDVGQSEIWPSWWRQSLL